MREGLLIGRLCCILQRTGKDLLLLRRRNGGDGGQLWRWCYRLCQGFWQPCHIMPTAALITGLPEQACLNESPKWMQPQTGRIR